MVISQWSVAKQRTKDNGQRTTNKNPYNPINTMNTTRFFVERSPP
ncbi:MAG: hypothetical protein ACKPKC_00620 [Dolichospermum sp.]